GAAPGRSTVKPSRRGAEGSTIILGAACPTAPSILPRIAAPRPGAHPSLQESGRPRATSLPKVRSDGEGRSRARPARPSPVRPPPRASLPPRGELAVRGDHHHLPAAARGVPRAGSRRRALPADAVDVAAAYRHVAR